MISAAPGRIEFIGNHTDYNVIYEDFEICRLLSEENSIIVWDDYYPDKFAIKDVIATVAEKYDYNMKLVECRGHLFSSKPPEKNCGTVIMCKKGFNEDIFSSEDLRNFRSFFQWIFF